MIMVAAPHTCSELNTEARYGSFPTPTTWFISAGRLHVSASSAVLPVYECVVLTCDIPTICRSMARDRCILG